MTAKVSLDQSARVQQSLSELTYRNRQIGKKVQSLEKQIAPQINKITRQLDKERRQPRKFIPIYDREKFLQWNEKSLSRLSKSLYRLFLEIRLYERKLQSYEFTIREINSEMFNG